MLAKLSVSCVNKGYLMTKFLEKPSVYVVDDDDAVRDSISAYLTLKGMKTTAFASAQELLKREDIPADLLVLDINMPDMDGFTLMKVLKNRGQNIPTVLITGFGDPQKRAKSICAGAVAIMDKPIDTPILYLTVIRILDETKNRVACSI
jgi:FixJ family two-component response regulator